MDFTLFRINPWSLLNQSKWWVPNLQSYYSFETTQCNPDDWCTSDVASKARSYPAHSLSIFPSGFIDEMLWAIKEESSCQRETGKRWFSRCSWLGLGILKEAPQPKKWKSSFHKPLGRTGHLVTCRWMYWKPSIEAQAIWKRQRVFKEMRSSHSWKHYVVKVSAHNWRDFRQTCKIV